MSLRKIGGIYWLSLGRIRISFCIKRKTRVTVAVAQRVVERDIARRRVRCGM